MHVAEIPKGAIFGELGILQKKRRAATIICKVTCDMGYITREDYERILLEVDKIKHEKKKRFFGVNVFRNAFSLDLADEVGYMFSKKKFGAGEHIFKQGDFDSKGCPFHVYVIQKGSIMVYVNERQGKMIADLEIAALTKNVAGPRKRNVALLSPGELFGETEIQEGVCKISAVCREPCAVWVLDRDKWLKLLRDKKLVAEFVSERILVKQKSRALWDINVKTIEKMRFGSVDRQKIARSVSKEFGSEVSKTKMGGTVRDRGSFAKNSPFLKK
jgi:CRP-like cAMP-binding protein